MGNVPVVSEPQGLSLQRALPFVRCPFGAGWADCLEDRRGAEAPDLSVAHGTGSGLSLLNLDPGNPRLFQPAVLLPNSCAGPTLGGLATPLA